jgi:hypothetical protein
MNMSRGLLAALVALLLPAGLVQAEAPPAVEEPVPSLLGPGDVLWSAPPVPQAESCAGCHEEVWLIADYLLWWVRHGPVNAPLVTTGSPADAAPGAIGQPSTALLFGNETVSFGTFSGVRLAGGFTLGEGWLVEGGLLALERRAVGRSFNSDANGNPVVARPYFDNQAGAPAAYLDANPCLLAGGAAVSMRTRLQGYELNAAVEAYSSKSLRLALLAGFRALELDEDLEVLDNVTGVIPGQVLFLTAPADPPNSLTILDRFRNYNHFYGGQIGGHLNWHVGPLDLGLTGKVALGTTQELAILDGTTTLITPGAAPTPNPGGILVQPSNTGRFYQSRFTYVPELGLDLGWWVTPQCRLALGYQFLYWSRVIRPGTEIDTTVNPAQVPQDARFGNGLGDARPAYVVRQTEFWAQGLSFGLLLQY